MMESTGMSKSLRQIVSVISRPSLERSATELIALLPSLLKLSAIFRNQETDVLVKMLKSCSYQKVTKDHVIIRQGDIGDSFYIQLTGRSSMYIDVRSDELLMTSSALARITHDKETGAGGEAGGGTGELVGGVRGDGTESRRQHSRDAHSGRHEGVGVLVKQDSWVEDWDGAGGSKKDKLDRNKFGNIVKTFGPGKSFGELALLSENSVRSASIIADETSDLLVISKQLFCETLKTREEEEYKERKRFIDESPLFGNWQPKQKRLLEMCLRKEFYSFDSEIVKQGQRVNGLFFIIRGEAKITMDPSVHRIQYPKVMNRQAKILAEILGTNFAVKEEPPTKRKESALLEQIRVRRREGYAAAERRIVGKDVTLCTVDHSQIVGATETICGLDTYMQSVTTTCDTEVFVLDSVNIDRLVFKPRVMSTIDELTDKVELRLRARLASRSGAQIELYRILLSIVEEMKKKKSKAADTRASRKMRSISVASRHLASASTDQSNDRAARDCDSSIKRRSTRPRSISPSPVREGSVSPRPNHSRHRKSPQRRLGSPGGSGRASETDGRPPRKPSQALIDLSADRHASAAHDARVLMIDKFVRVMPRSKRELERLSRAPTSSLITVPPPSSAFADGSSRAMSAATSNDARKRSNAAAAISLYLNPAPPDLPLTPTKLQLSNSVAQMNRRHMRPATAPPIVIGGGRMSYQGMDSCVEHDTNDFENGSDDTDKLKYRQIMDELIELNNDADINMHDGGKSGDDDGDVILLNAVEAAARMPEIVRELGEHRESLFNARCDVILSNTSDRRCWTEKKLSVHGKFVLQRVRPSTAAASLQTHNSLYGTGRSSRVSAVYTLPTDQLPFDPETSDETLDALERDVRQFCEKSHLTPADRGSDTRRSVSATGPRGGTGSGVTATRGAGVGGGTTGGTAVVQRLNRFSIATPYDVPFPAGTVIVRRRPSTAATGLVQESAAAAAADRINSAARKTRSLSGTTRRFIIPRGAYTLVCDREEAAAAAAAAATKAVVNDDDIDNFEYHSSDQTDIRSKSSITVC